jgi:hypothetical protein
LHGSDQQAASKEPFMSNSTRPGGYDERLVVPLEASRRGAHRARVNPLLSVLPLLAVVVVVVAVVGLAYTLFVKGSNGSDDNGTASAPTTTAPAATQPTPSVSASGSSSSTRPSASASTSAPATAKVDKGASFTVYNGSTAHVTGLAKRAETALGGAGFGNGHVVSGATPVGTTQSTKIYYASSSQKATAEALKDALGGVGVVKLSSSIAGQGIVVVVGDDYAS